MVASRHPIRSALWLVLSLLSTAVCFLLLDAAFAAAVQVVAYVGAIVVLVLFAVMLLNLKGDALDRRRPSQWIVAVSLAIGFLAVMLPPLRSYLGAPQVAEGFGEVRQVGEALMGPQLLPFELVSLLLLAAMVAAIVVGKKGDA